MEKKEKYKAAVVSKLFAGTETPFTKQVIDHPLPHKFKTPQIPSYSGVGDPIEHLKNYRIHLTLHAIPDEIASRAFLTTLSGNTREWFRSLAPNSVATFEDLARIFLTHFLGSRERKKPSRYLLTLHQREGESLKEFMIRFNTEKLKVENPTDGVIFSAVYNGISPDEPVARKIARKQPNTLQELLDKVEEFINEKETLKAMRSAQKTPKKLEEKKRKDLPRFDTPKHFKKKFSNHNFTPLNANISKVLMEIKKDPEYRRPLGAPQNQNSDRYYEFH
ncbi:uncharacterized protein LOC132167275 [Corylus avellana]|uniref:uncharacterized protein LOC132167275 n=1 Tax=Corylus avellana TaxID=13451 RepID=UPI00286A3A3A|nr:uncharacterized protein LOC132167275 [Corylus avellana]